MNGTSSGVATYVFNSIEPPPPLGEVLGGPASLGPVTEVLEDSEIPPNTTHSIIGENCAGEEAVAGQAATEKVIAEKSCLDSSFVSPQHSHNTDSARLANSTSSLYIRRLSARNRHRR